MSTHPAHYARVGNRRAMEEIVHQHRLQSSFFDGRTFSPAEDGERLTTQLERVRERMADGRWWTIAELTAAVGGSEAGVSARIRDLKKARFGAFNIERERVEGGLWRYRMGRAS